MSQHRPYSAGTPFVRGPHTYRGSCHCGAIRFEADIDFTQGTTRCNCTHCTKTGKWGTFVSPSAFRLLEGAEAALERFNASDYGARCRCTRCNVEPFGLGNIPELGGELVTINVRCVDDTDLTGVPVHFVDGHGDTWTFYGQTDFSSPYPG